MTLLHGDEPLLIEESYDAMRKLAAKHGFEERIRLSAEPGFDWNQLHEHAQSLSLFASRKLLELRLPSGRPGEPGARAIAGFCERPSADAALLIIAGRLEARVKQSRWVKAIDKCGVIIEHRAIGPDRLPGWIRARLDSRGLRADAEVVQLLCHYLEGNLLAAAQEIDKLALLCTDGRLSADRIMSSIGDHARFDVYAFVDVCLSGDTPKAVRMLHSLRGEGAEPVLVNWALTREIRVMAQLAAGLASGQSRAQLFRAYNIWARRNAVVTEALKRLNVSAWRSLLQQAADADRVAKGRADGDVWWSLERICLTLGGVKTVTAAQSG